MSKLRCKNCGTVIKDTDFSCPICHMKPERTEEEVKKVEERIITGTEKKKYILKAIIAFLLLVGIVLTFFGFVRINDASYCTNEKCSSNNMFMFLLGLTFVISSSITLFKFRNK